ncbi:MAG: sigma-54-dependent Fis family transcriptional regulator [Deltaproteobacteria bacterium]|nr:sigma-54-dependent Fis family transcriptional regulator [Deltaproteobacteria bacterium]
MNTPRQRTELVADTGDLPFAHGDQLRVERSLQRLLRGEDEAAIVDVRPLVLDSWLRTQRAGVDSALKRAPLVWTDDELESARERTEWLPVAVQAIYQQCHASLEAGHILTLFDEGGRMLSAEGDPEAREGLADINFRPGAQWTEDLVGTNGPGTALAMGRPVHVVGAEHFCEGWQNWHCAATPVRDPATGAIIAIVDISGFREKGHPHTLALATVIASAIEQRLLALDSERRVLLLQRFAELSGRWPGETLVAVDRTGALLASTKDTPQALTQLSRSSRLRTLLDQAAGRVKSAGTPELQIALDGGLFALCRPVFDGPALAGSCLVLQRPSHSPSSRTPPRAARAQPNQTRYTLDDVLGTSPAIARALVLARAATQNTLPILITGESGTGKEVFAQGIHAGSARAQKAFVGVNCASLSRELIESEFFGYVGGAFSGARREGAIGKFEAADGGTLFLDEIAELSAEAQATLLRVLQEDEFVPVGGARPKPIDVRIIAATNRDLAACLRAGTLREDLFHRLNVLAIPLPALRERTVDLPVLAERFLQEALVDQAKSGLTLTPALLEAFARHAWPGNVRELKNLMRRLVALAQGPLTDADLPPQLQHAATPAPVRVDQTQAAHTQPAAQAQSSSGAAAPDPSAAPSVDVRTPDVHRSEDDDLARLMETVGSAKTMTEAAAMLGVTRSTLYRQLARRGLRPERILRPKA